MKIIHTSDLHIGKKLYNCELAEEQTLFFEYLINYIQNNNIEILLISGDIFDLANPSAEAERLYYEFLVNLNRINCKVIITGGNHDSPSVLNAPKDILKILDIHVIGKSSDVPENLIIPYPNNANPKLIIAAVPYLRESDIRKYDSSKSYDEAIEDKKNNIIEYYKSLKNIIKQKYQDIPVIAMGHLYITGASTSESERELRIGNLDKVESKNFAGMFDYLALGHIHKPYGITDDNSVAYSGSPYPLSFSEYDDKKRMLEVEINDLSTTLKSIEIPKFRNLLKISGDFEKIKNKLNDYDNSAYSLTSFAEVELIMEENSPSMMSDFDNYMQNYNNDNLTVLKYKITNKADATNIAEHYSSNIQIEDLLPADVFSKRIENEELSEEEKTSAKDAFMEVLDLIQRGNEQ
jgi:exonuclease SbcD